MEMKEVLAVRKEKRKMSDLISRQVAINAVNKIAPVNTEYDCTLLDILDVRYVLTELPSAEPEIIRCGQCKYAEAADSEDSQDGYTCQFHRGSIWFSGNYCSWAEWRGDEE